MSHYMAFGEFHVKIVENTLIRNGLVRLPLWEWGSQVIVIKRPAECQMRFEPGTIRF